ncbi:protein ANTAGONIST OF LIKE HETEROCHROMATIN PROTEIN 1-like [Anneissia japonica]|uniref:protein ANTAGONIST OF LIKE HETEROCHROMATIN PROTEIN 1-like n=1 Tax=Anneissia japonica TaxID=1529436 RepID=UPI0014254F21|nr:protein ANTAGONIST OF LIKE HETEROCHROMATIN PROTEIN 1-like [Anneissia japonica]
MMVFVPYQQVILLLSNIMTTMMRVYIDGINAQNEANLAAMRHMRRRRRARRQAVLQAALAYNQRVNPVERQFLGPRVSAWWDAAPRQDDRFWKENFRMSQPVFNILCDILRPRLQRDALNGFSVEKVVALALYRLSTPSDLRTIANLFGVGRSTVCELVQEVCVAMIDVMMQQYIVWPTGNRLRRTIQAFEEKHGFPQCAGAVDGTHIPIIGPAKNPADYHNRKGWYSMILQAVVDNKLRFTDINVGFPGRVHDARVLRNSTLYEKGQNGDLFPAWYKEINGTPMPIVILGDPAYPLLPWLMKGFSEGANFGQQERTFNYRLSRARMVVERAFGQLKGRWRILMRRNDSALKAIPQMVTSCCILHNFCIEHNEVYEAGWDQMHVIYEQPQADPVHDVVPSADDIRNALLGYFR